MGATSALIWLVSCILITLGLSAVVLTVIVRRVGGPMEIPGNNGGAWSKTKMAKATKATRATNATRAAKATKKLVKDVQEGWPDFTIVDRGEQIHFVPLDEDGHLVGSDLCPCHPRRTGNRRRSGRGVVYVDHQCLHPHSTLG